MVASHLSWKPLKGPRGRFPPQGCSGGDLGRKEQLALFSETDALGVGGSRLKIGQQTRIENVYLTCGNGAGSFGE